MLLMMQVNLCVSTSPMGCNRSAQNTFYLTLKHSLWVRKGILLLAFSRHMGFRHCLYFSRWPSWWNKQTWLSTAKNVHPANHNPPRIILMQEIHLRNGNGGVHTVRKWAVERMIWHTRLLSIQMSLLLAEEYLCNELMDFMLCDLHKA